MQHTEHILPSSFVTEIVKTDYRTADVFRKYDIDFCCGGKWPLEMACISKGLDTGEVIKELRRSIRNTVSVMTLDFDDWDLDFLVDYILNIHHRYLKKALPDVHDYVTRFLAGHRKKFPEMSELEVVMQNMMIEIPPHMQKEEEIIFPYIKQIFHAWQHRESYASLLIRTLRKPVEEVMEGEHESVGRHLHRLRELTQNYTIPEAACVTHRVTFQKLKEFDESLVQHIHLESNILFPKAISMEQELLRIKD